jgi:hypothetical protein
MDAEKPTAGALSKIAIFQGIAMILLALFAGAVCPQIAGMLQDPENPASWQASLLFGLKWHWTLPVGVVLAVLTVWISSRLQEKGKAVFLLLASLLLLAFAGFLTWLMLSI